MLIFGVLKNYMLGAPKITLDFSGVCVAKSLVFCVVFCRSLAVCPFTVGYSINDILGIIYGQA